MECAEPSLVLLDMRMPPAVLHGLPEVLARSAREPEGTVVLQPASEISAAIRCRYEREDADTIELWVYGDAALAAPFGRAYRDTMADERPPLNLPPSSAAERERQVLIVNQDTWWAVDDGVTTNTGDPFSTHGTETLDMLLHPSPLVEGLTFTAARRTSEAGRAAILVRATPTDRLIWTAPGLVVLGAEQVSVVVDTTLGIVLRFSAVIAGGVAREHRIQSISEVHGLDPTLFQAPPG